MLCFAADRSHFRQCQRARRVQRRQSRAGVFGGPALLFDDVLGDRIQGRLVDVVNFLEIAVEQEPIAQRIDAPRHALGEGVDAVECIV